MNLTPTVKFVVANGCIEAHFHYPHSGVDRVCTNGMTIGKDAPAKRKLAERVKSAVEAGKFLTDQEVKTDVSGQTYVCHRVRAMGRTLNADLNRLGF